MNQTFLKRFSVTASVAFSLMLITGCKNDSVESGPSGSTAGLAGEIKIDGSSTVYPVSQAIAEEWGKLNSNVIVGVGKSGTGGGMKKFVAGEIDICDASRAIEDEEIKAAEAKGIEFIELPIAYDGLSVVVNAKNTWADHLTVAELKAIWGPDSMITNWKDIRPGFPNKPLKLYGPGTASGTFEYFTEAIVGKKKSSRSDYTASEDDNTLVQGVVGDEGSLGYFGYAYYSENSDKIKAVKIDSGKGPVEPSEITINNNSYAPLSRPLFLYITKKAMERPEVQSFVKFYLSSEGQALIGSTGYVTLPGDAYTLIQGRADKMTVGSVFAGRSTVGMPITDILKAEGP